MKIYLASASPRRKELLKQVGISFKVVPSTVEEKITKEAPEEFLREAYGGGQRGFRRGRRGHGGFRLGKNSRKACG